MPIVHNSMAVFFRDIGFYVGIAGLPMFWIHVYTRNIDRSSYMAVLSPADFLCGTLDENTVVDEFSSGNAMRTPR